MLHSSLVAFLCAVALGFGASAHAVDCSSRQSAGYRVLSLDDGRKVAVWYPAASAEQPASSSRTGKGLASRVAVDAAPAALPST